MPYSLASVSIENGLLKSGSARAGADINCVFSNWKASSVVSVHTNGTPFLSRLDSGLAMTLKLRTNLLYYPASPKKLRTALTSVGGVQLDTACILVGSVDTP